MSIVRPVARRIVLPVVRKVTDLGLGDGLDAKVKALFASGEKGVMFDFTRAANLYTDSARTTLVTANGDRIGSATDLSGNGKHASSAGTARPIFGSDTMFDALDDYLQTAAIDFSATDAVTVVASVRKSSDAALAFVMELSAAASANAGTFNLFAPAAANASYGNQSRGTGSAVTASTVNAAWAAPHLAVLTTESDISSDMCAFRVNGAAGGSSSGDQGTGNYGNYPLNIGARNAASFFFNGRIYRLLVIGRALTTTERSTAERWAAQPAGIII